ncbi:unnamed protein product [Allacma fusca]|uniref:Uncharacterized protein n=1 Tax=Allacma fusca TaxID=39272 RepID=A0A8J2NIN6_9HEXA|nr:unnamed protein product [Allacma fusca]
MKFLKSEVDDETRISMAKVGLGLEEPKTNKPKSKKQSQEETPTAAGLFTGSMKPEVKKCGFCDKGHSSQECFKAAKMIISDKNKVIKAKKLCFVCLTSGHTSANFCVDTKVTKRVILSCAHRVFDPIGFTCPFTVVPKLLLQKSWSLKLGWDDELPEEITKEFHR